MRPLFESPVRRAFVVLRSTLGALVDRHNGIRTEGTIDLSELGCQDSERVHYMPSRWSTLPRTLSRLVVNPDDVFLDIGSGLGRVVFQAARYPFRKVIGVEVSEDLHRIAEANIERNRGRLRARHVELVVADAVTYQVPDDVTIVYLFNPFVGDVFARVLQNVFASVDRRPRRVRLIYRNPVEHEWLLSTGRVRLVDRVPGLRPTAEWSRSNSTHLYEIAGAGHPCGPHDAHHTHFEPHGVVARLRLLGRLGRLGKGPRREVSMEDGTSAMPARAVPSEGAGREVGGRQPERLDVVEVDPSGDPRWEAFVAAHPSGTVYHHPLWLEVLQREYAQRSVHLACLDPAGRFHGVLPLLCTRGVPGGVGGHLAGRRLASLPRTPVAGPLAVGAEAAAALVQRAVERVDAEPGLRLQLKRPGPDLDGLVPGVEPFPWRVSYVLDLPDRADQLRFGDSRSHTRIKSSAAKASKHGVTVRVADDTRQLRQWYRLYLDTMRAHLVPARPYRLFEAMWDLLRPRGMMRLLVAETDEGASGRVVAGSILLMYGRTVFYAFNGRDPEMLWTRSNDALQWRAIHDAVAEGFRAYDLGEVSTGNQGLADFKKKWAANPRTLYRYHYPAATAGTTGRDGHDSARGRARALAAAAWHRVPTRVTAVVGEQVYRFL